MLRLLVALVVVSNVYSFECSTLEAQVFAKVTSVEMDKNTCLYNVVVEQINEHILCPLTVVEIEDSQIISKNYGSCYEVGASFGHILVKDINSGTIFID